MKIKCENCNGTGLVGNGPVPHEHVGNISTCPACNGTGVVDAPENKPAEEASVDNAPVAEGERGGIISRIFG